MRTNEEPCFVQGTPEWLDLRRSKVTATDASIIMGANPWKTKAQLYKEKTTAVVPLKPNERMQRGIDLEPIARELFTLKTGIEIEPKVIIKDWQMASLDGYHEVGKCVVEIKCPGPKDHAKALEGKVPDHYYPQLQHQMHVCDVDEMIYFSFDGHDGVIVEVNRDQKYIDKMIVEERSFYDAMISGVFLDNDEYKLMEDAEWLKYASQWQGLSEYIKSLEKQQEILKEKLVQLSGASNCQGAGVRLSRVERKGNIDYSNIPELQAIDLEKYRKPSTNMWRISQE